MKIFLNFTFLLKTQLGQKTAWNFPNFLKKSSRQMLGYPSLVTGLNISWFLEVKASLWRDNSNNNSDRFENDLKRQVPASPVVLAMVLPAQLLLFKIQ